MNKSEELCKRVQTLLYKWYVELERALNDLEDELESQKKLAPAPSCTITEQREELSLQLAKYFNPEKQRVGPCACLGIKCLTPRCSRWWEIFLETFSKQEIACMVETALKLKEKQWR